MVGRKRSQPASSRQSKALEEAVTKDQSGVVEEVLPRDMYRVRLDDGRSIRAGLSSSVRHSIVRIIAGIRVLVRLSPHDPARGQITKKLQP